MDLGGSPKMEGQKVTSRKYYEMELQKLNASLLEMGEMIRMAIGGAVTALLDVALLRAAAADTGVTDITQKGQTLLLSLGQRMDVPSLMAVCTLPAYRSRLLLSAGEHPKLTLHLKPGEEALDAAGHLVEALTLKRKEISGETPAEGGTL